MDLARVLGLFVQGSASNWWGLGCPAHCSGSLTVLGLAFGFGAPFGFLCAVIFFSTALLLPLPRLPSLLTHLPCLLHLLDLPPCAFEVTCMSRWLLTETIRSLVDALRGALAELEADSGAEWEVVEVLG